MAGFASMMSAFSAAWSLLKARDDRLVHGRMTAPPPIVGMLERLRQQGMLGEAGDVRDQQVPLSEANMPRSVLQDEKRPPMPALLPVDVSPGQGDVVPVNIQQVERSVAPLREDVETMMGGGGQMNPETGKIVDAGTPGAINAMPTTTRKIPGYETMPEESYHTRGEQRLARDQMGNVLGRTVAGQMGERTNIRGGSGAGINNPMRQSRLRRRAANLENVEGTVAGGGERSLAFGTGEAGRAMESHRAAQEANVSPTESALNALRALQGMPGVTIDESGVEPAEEFRPSQLSTTSGMESGSSNLSGLGRRRKEMQDISVFNSRMSPEQRQQLMELGGQLDPATMALLEGRGNPQAAMQGERRAQLLQDADAMARTESRAAQAQADRS